ncbi:MAG: DUF559 domain-containing protein [Proteobacteria bacterium]|nr:DUF559 domain-containing protein [Pseudomonadota bacterium]
MLRQVVYRARQLRRDMSVPERLLWQRFRQRPNGIKFRRQHPIGPYIVDFCCLSHRLVVEIEGVVHDMGQQHAYDQRRFEFIKSNGFRVIRVSARRVLADAVGTANAILARVEGPLHRPVDGPPPRAGEAN